MSDVADIEDHYAWHCTHCGCVDFNLLKSGRIECSNCGEIILNAEWRESQPSIAMGLSPAHPLYMETHQVTKELTEQQINEAYNANTKIHEELKDHQDHEGDPIIAGYNHGIEDGCKLGFSEGYRAGRQIEKNQSILMRYDPQTGAKAPYPSTASDYREWHGRVAWLYNPWTRGLRSTRDIASDVQGLLIQPEEPSE